jgi:hypothetical protein
MLIVNDASQKLKRRKRFSWSSVGIKAQGRSRKLAKNYRNTKEVRTTAWQLLSQLSDQDQDADETFPVVTPEVSERSGPLPKLILVTQADQLASRALESAQAELKHGRSSIAMERAEVHIESNLCSGWRPPCSGGFPSIGSPVTRPANRATALISPACGT